MKPTNTTPFSDANATASQAGVITNDMAPSEKPVAADRALKTHTSFGRVKQDGTVNLDGVLGRSRFDRK